MGNDSEDISALRSKLEALQEENAGLRSRLAQPRVAQGGDSEFLQSLLRALPTFVVRIGPDLRISFINRLAVGFRTEDAVGRSVLDFISPEYHERVRSTVGKACRTGNVERYTVTGQGDHAGPAHYETIVAPVNEPGGERGAILVSFDTTAQVERERALIESEEQLRLAVDATGIGLWTIDLKTGRVWWNERTREIMGRDAPLPMDRYVPEAVHPEDREIVGGSMGKLQEGEDNAWTPHRIQRPDGEVRWIIPSGKVVRDAEGKAVRIVGGHLDVTSTHQLENRLREAEKMEALGTLTTGVAHNLNNLLAVIRPTLDLLEDYVRAQGRDLLTEAVRATDRASNVVRQLMTFAGKRRAARPQVVLLSKLVQEAVDLSRRSMPPNIQLYFASTLPQAMVRVDPSELSEVFANLLVNARDALLEAGTAGARIEVTVEGVRTAPGVATAAGTAVASPGLARVVVSDNGPGIEESVRRRVFDPFFTTKAPGKGTGLGLAISWSVARAAGGSMDCESSPGESTRFSVYLPLVAGAPSQRPKLETERPGSGGLRVLLVDDNEQVRAVTRRILMKGHHVVVEAATARAAVAAAEQQAFDVILLDQSLPDARGSQIVPELRRLSGGKVLLFTGQDVDRGELREVDGLLSKPLRAKDLLDALSRVMQR